MRISEHAAAVNAMLLQCPCAAAFSVLTSSHPEM